MCSAITKKDVSAFKDWLNNAWTNLGMVNYPYPASFLEPLPGWPVKVCVLFYIIMLFNFIYARGNVRYLLNNALIYLGMVNNIYYAKFKTSAKMADLALILGCHSPRARERIILLKFEQ